jgi:hypothetical protein
LEVVILEEGVLDGNDQVPARFEHPAEFPQRPVGYVMQVLSLLFSIPVVVVCMVGTFMACHLLILCEVF